MRIIATCILILMLTATMRSQNATATLGTITACPPDMVLVPVDVTNFIDVAAMTIFIGYDTNTTSFISLANINSQIPGGLFAFASNGQIGISYSDITPFSITNGKLFDLQMQFLVDSSLLTFNTGTEIANSNLEVIPLDTFDGGIFNAITITSQPDSIQAYPNTDVTFTVIATGNIQYQWQENAGSGWTDLQNSFPYSGTNTPTLTIQDVSLSFDNYTYRCVLSTDNCEVISDIALLEVQNAYPVATIGTVTSCPESFASVPLFVGDFYDVVHFIFNISYDTSVAEFQSLENIYSDLLQGSLTINQLNDPAGISIEWTSETPVNIPSGKLFDMDFYYHSGSTALIFEPGTIVLNSLSYSIDITLTNGHLTQKALPVILSQPENLTVQEGDDATFSVGTTGATAFQWQVSENSGGTWTDLTNTPPYTNVSTSELTITATPYALNNNYYLCRVNNYYCSVLSEPAILTVDTLTAIDNKPANNPETVMAHPNPFNQSITVDYCLPYSGSIVLVIQDLTGQTIENIFSGDQEKGNHTIKVNTSGYSPGFYFLCLKLNSISKSLKEVKKIIKTD
jgi:hypothetical protein